MAEDQETVPGGTFAQEAEKRRTGALSELWYFLRHNKRWWLTPIVIALIVVAVLILFAGSAAGPLIYPLF